MPNDELTAKELRQGMSSLSKDAREGVERMTNIHIEAMVSESNAIRCENLLYAEAKKYLLSPKDYLRKIWYHQQAAIIGEYFASVLLDGIIPFAPLAMEPEVKEVLEGEVQP